MARSFLLRIYIYIWSGVSGHLANSNLMVTLPSSTLVHSKYIICYQQSLSHCCIIIFFSVECLYCLIRRKMIAVRIMFRVFFCGVLAFDYEPSNSQIDYRPWCFIAVLFLVCPTLRLEDCMINVDDVLLVVLGRHFAISIWSQFMQSRASVWPFYVWLVCPVTAEKKMQRWKEKQSL